MSKETRIGDERIIKPNPKRLNETLLSPEMRQILEKIKLTLKEAVKP